MTTHEAYLDHARSADLTDRNAFRSLVRDGLDLTGISLREAAEQLSTAPGTVSRWVNGHSAPAVVARRAIVDFFSARVRRIVKRAGRTSRRLPEAEVA